MIAAVARGSAMRAKIIFATLLILLGGAAVHLKFPELVPAITAGKDERVLILHVTRSPRNPPAIVRVTWLAPWPPEKTGATGHWTMVVTVGKDDHLMMSVAQYGDGIVKCEILDAFTRNVIHESSRASFGSVRCYYPAPS